MPMSVAVLCGGRSERMGRDKASLPFGGESMLSRAVRIARLASDDVLLVGPMTAEASQARDLVDPGQGPLVALAMALRSARESHVLLLACDMPLVVPAMPRHLRALAGDSDACVADVADALVARGGRSLRALLEVIRVRWVEEEELRAVDPDLASFIDCDTPEDYARALKFARHEGAE